MFKTICLLAIANLLFTSVYSQEDLNNIFAFVYDPQSSGDISLTDIAVPDHIQEIFEDLLEAKGDKSMPIPKLVVSSSERIAAWAHPSSQTIGIEQKAIEVCRSLGKDSLDAVAGLLAHELIHYYENHDWKNHFLRNYTAAAELRSSDTERGREMEIEADQMGGLLAHMAGYNSLSSMPTLLENIYGAYHLSITEDTEYPSLKSRKDMANLGAEHLKQMIPIYDMANYFIVIGAYEEAILYLQQITNKTAFRSRELYNNLGLLHGMLAYEKRPNANDHFQYGFQLDLSSRLATRGIREEGFENVCKTAISYFEQAIALDKSYAPAYLNLANVYTMVGEIEDAEYMIYKARKTGSLEESGLKLILGNIAARQGNKEKAHELWMASSEAGNQIATKNLNAASDHFVNNSEMQEQTKPKVDDIDLDKLYAQILRDEITPDFSYDLTEQVSFYTVELPRSTIYIHMDYSADERFSFFQQIKDDQEYNDKEHPELQIADSPDVIFATNNGSVNHYKKYNLLTRNVRGQLKDWCVYKYTLN